MPIPVTCPNCQARSNAPDAAAGRRVKCPKCQTPIPVPGEKAPRPTPQAPPLPEPVAGSQFEVVESEPKSAKKPRPPAADGNPFEFDAGEEGPRDSEKPRGKKRRRDEDDEDEGDDAPPRRGGKGKGRGEKPAGKKWSTTLVLILVGAGVLFLGCCVGGPIAGYYYLYKKADEFTQQVKKELDKTTAKDTPTKPRGPAGWTAKAGDGFEAFFPGEPKEASIPPVPQLKGTMYMGQTADESLSCVVMAVHYEGKAVSAQQEKALSGLRELFLAGGKKGGPPPKPLSEKPVTWLGQPAKEFVYEMSEPDGTKEQLVVRQRPITFDNRGFIAIIGAKGGRPKPEDEKNFFDNFKVLN